MLFTVISHSECLKFVPCFVDESTPVGEESAVDGVEDGKLSESLHGKKQHGTDNDEPYELKLTVSGVIVGVLLLREV